MKNYILYFLAFLGVVFLGLLAFAAYFFVTDPYNLRPLLFGTSVPFAVEAESGAELKAAVDSSSALELTPQQKEAVTAIGIDPAAIPETINTEQESCFVEILGEARVAEIKAGAVPSGLEFARASVCL